MKLKQALVSCGTYDLSGKAGWLAGCLACCLLRYFFMGMGYEDGLGVRTPTGSSSRVTWPRQ